MSRSQSSDAEPIQHSSTRPPRSEGFAVDNTMLGVKLAASRVVREAVLTHVLAGADTAGLPLLRPAAGGPTARGDRLIEHTDLPLAEVEPSR